MLFMPVGKDNPVGVWDITLPCSLVNNQDNSLHWLKNALDQCSKEWHFQLEKGESGLLHYQIRLSLKTKMRQSTMLNKSKNDKLPIPGRWSITSKAVMEEMKTNHDAFYVLKEDTRIEGPWSSTDTKGRYYTKQIQLFETYELRPYQKLIKLECEKFDLRRIDIIYDEIGNVGKSLLTEWLEYEGLAEEVPPFRAMEDIMGWVATRPIHKAYIIDMPRGMKKDKLADFYAGIESLKNGLCYDKRYSANKIRFDRPRIFVFTNSLPVFELLSKDRWVIWKMNKEFDVDIYSAEEYEKEFLHKDPLDTGCEIID